jgi:regulatory protein
MSGRVTALKAQIHNPQRVNVFLDGEFAFGLSRITAGWLYIGQELSDAKIAELQAEDAREVALQKALHFLEYRPRSQSEVQRNLEKHAVPAEVIADVLERLQHNGMIDDARFAQAWIENRNTFRPRGRRALAVEMRRRGLEQDTIDVALEHIDESQEETLAYQAAQKQLRKLQDLEWPEFRNKLGNFLVRRGFGYDVVRVIVERTWKELNEVLDQRNEPT